MGSWTMTCSLSNLPIHEDDPVYLIPTIYGEVRRATGSSYQFESNSDANMVGLPIEGTYDSYGGIHIHQRGQEAALLFKSWFLGNYMVPVEKPDNYDSLSWMDRYFCNNKGVFALLSKEALESKSYKSFGAILNNFNDRDCESLEYLSFDNIYEYSEDNQKIVPKQFFENLYPEKIINDFIERETIAIRSGKDIKRLGFIFILKDVYDDLKNENKEWFKNIPTIKSLSTKMKELMKPWSSLSEEEKQDFKDNFFIKDKEFDEKQYQGFFEMNREQDEEVFKYVARSGISKPFFIRMVAALYFDFNARNKSQFNEFVRSYIEMQKMMIMINMYNCSLFPKPGKGGQTYDYDHIKSLNNIVLKYIDKKEDEKDW